MSEPGYKRSVGTERLDTRSPFAIIWKLSRQNKIRTIPSFPLTPQLYQTFGTIGKEIPFSVKASTCLVEALSLKMVFLENDISIKRMQTYSQSLVNKLDSGEQLNTNTNFETEITFIRTPSNSRGRGKERSFGRRNVEAFLKAKRSVSTLVLLKFLSDVKVRPRFYF